MYSKFEFAFKPLEKEEAKPSAKYLVVVWKSFSIKASVCNENYNKSIKITEFMHLS